MLLPPRPNIDAELGLITLRLQRQELEEVFLVFVLFNNLFLLFLHFQLLDNLLLLDLNQGGNKGSSDVDAGLRDGAAAFKMVNFEVLHPPQNS